MTDETLEALAQRAESLIVLNRYKDAQAQLGLALAKAPENIDLLFMLAHCQYMQEDFLGAETTNRSNLRLTPDNPWALHMHSLIMHKLLHFDKELEYAEEACRLAPDNADMLQRLAEAQMQSGLRTSAKATADQLVKLDPNSYSAHELLAELNVNLSRWDAAESHSREALRLQPDVPHLHQWLAEALFSQQRYEDAISTQFHAVQLNPQSDHAQHRLYEMTDTFLHKRVNKTSRSDREQAIPAEVLAYYNDKAQRTPWFEKHSVWVYAIGWVIGGTVLVGLLDYLTK